MNDDNGADFSDDPWYDGTWNEQSENSLFEKDCVYILVVENDKGKVNNYVGCYWTGNDFCPLKGIYLVKPYIKANEPINNRVKILSVRKM